MKKQDGNIFKSIKYLYKQSKGDIFVTPRAFIGLIKFAYEAIQ